MTCNFQRCGTRYGRDGLLKGSKNLNVRRPDGHRGQHTQCDSGDAEQGAKWPLEGMGPYQSTIEPEWYSHLERERGMNKTKPHR